MALVEETLFGTVDKVQIAIDRLRQYEPAEGYYLAYSGGKDSDTILALAKMSGVKFDAHYQLTTVDPPEVVQHIKAQAGVQIHHPEKTMWRLIVENGMPPLRQMRYCCRILKERGGDGRVVVTGIRSQESARRAKRELWEPGRKNDKMYLHVIFDWTFDDVWEFINGNNISYCNLYDEGWKRLGCVCCPMANQKKEAERWPKIAEGYRRACIRAYDRRIKEAGEKGIRPNTKWESGEEMFDWWIQQSRGKREDMSYCTDDQSVLFD